MSNFDIAQKDRSSPGLKGWHVLMCFLGFFTIMFTVNGIFLYHAITSFPGEDVKKSYVQGLDYNRTLSARKAQRDLGWSAQAGHDQGKLIFQLRDRYGQSVFAHQVLADIRHAATTQKDQTVHLERSASGEYTADIHELEPGKWTVQFSVLSPEDETVIFQAHKNIVVTP